MENNMKRIAIVEDDETLRSELKVFLEKNGYEVSPVTDFKNSISVLLSGNYDLILLDINLPNTDGEHILKEVRKESDVPVIMMTSRDSDMDELLSMSFGADDYVTKPFNTQILLARIAAILKRMDRSSDAGNKIQTDAFTLNIGESRLERDGRIVELSKNERKIMQCLMEQRNQIVSRDAIMEYLWDSDEFVDDNTLTVNMTRVRAKLEELGLKDQIVTKRGQGYLLI